RLRPQGTRARRDGDVRRAAQPRHRRDADRDGDHGVASGRAPSMQGRAGELAMALLVLAVGGLSLYGSSHHRYYTDFGPDAGFFPFWLGLAQTILGVALLVGVLRGRIGSRPSAPLGSRRQLAAAALLVGYVA